jgi:hypothetical protein
MNTTLRIRYRTLAIDYVQTREQWLNNLAQRMAPLYASLGAGLPKRVRIAIGFTSTGRKFNRLGECWDNQCSADGHFEIFIRPDLAESADTMPMQIAAILAHELTHAAVGIAAKLGRAFAKVAKGLGLTGKMRSTVRGPEFEQAIAPLLLAVGPLPHGRLNAGGLSTRPKKQDSRYLKATCEECGYTVRVIRKWLEIGLPKCPEHGDLVPDGVDGACTRHAA